jgi:hypothetical protein
MKWVITERVHYDRVASCWLIKNFVDKEAQFLFANNKTPLDSLPKGAIPLAFPGAKLGPHDDNGTLFTHILTEYKITDPALWKMEKVVTGGVRFYRQNPRPVLEDRFIQIGVGLITLADGMQLLYTDDQKRLDASYGSWDAMYALYKANKERTP